MDQHQTYILRNLCLYTIPVLIMEFGMKRIESQLIFNSSCAFEAIASVVIKAAPDNYALPFDKLH